MTALALAATSREGATRPLPSSSTHSTRPCFPANPPLPPNPIQRHRRGQRDATRALVLSGAPIIADDLLAPGQRLGANQFLNLHVWACRALDQHVAYRTFLLGCHGDGSVVSKLGGVANARELIGALIGVKVGVELRRLRAAELTLRLMILDGSIQATHAVPSLVFSPGSGVVGP